MTKIHFRTSDPIKFNKEMTSYYGVKSQEGCNNAFAHADMIADIVAQMLTGKPLNQVEDYR